MACMEDSQIVSSRAIHTTVRMESRAGILLFRRLAKPLHWFTVIGCSSIQLPQLLTTSSFLLSLTLSGPSTFRWVFLISLVCDAIFDCFPPPLPFYKPMKISYGLVVLFSFWIKMNFPADSLFSRELFWGFSFRSISRASFEWYKSRYIVFSTLLLIMIMRKKTRCFWMYRA